MFSHGMFMPGLPPGGRRPVVTIAAGVVAIFLASRDAMDPGPNNATSSSTGVRRSAVHDPSAAAVVGDPRACRRSPVTSCTRRVSPEEPSGRSDGRGGSNCCARMATTLHVWPGTPIRPATTWSAAFVGQTPSEIATTAAGRSVVCSNSTSGG